MIDDSIVLLLHIEKVKWTKCATKTAELLLLDQLGLFFFGLCYRCTACQNLSATVFYLRLQIVQLRLRARLAQVKPFFHICSNRYGESVVKAILSTGSIVFYFFF